MADVRRIRRQLGLTQQALAGRAGLSQSMIAKIEAGLLDPSYSNAKKIFKAIDALKAGTEKKAKDIMQKKIITITSSTTIRQAIERMRKYSISQIPVMDNSHLLGMVTESDMLNILITGKNAEKVGDVMEDLPPSVAMDASITVILNLLRFYSSVLVLDKGRLRGIITKFDVLENLYE